MATIKANKDKARFISNPISQDALDGDWVDHEVITKYKLPEITVDASTTTISLESYDVITTGDKLKVLDGASMVDRTAGTVTTTGGSSSTTWDIAHSVNYSLDATSLIATKTINGGTNIYSLAQCTTGVLIAEFVHSGGTDNSFGYGICKNNTFQDDNFGSSSDGYMYYYTGNKHNNGVVAYGSAFASGDVIKVTYTHSTGVLEFAVNGVSQGVAYTLTPNTDVYLACFENTAGNISTIQSSSISTLKYQAPLNVDGILTATTNIPTKAYFNKTIDTTLSAEATGKCKSSTITQIGVL